MSQFKLPLHFCEDQELEKSPNLCPILPALPWKYKSVGAPGLACLTSTTLILVPSRALMVWFSNGRWKALGRMTYRRDSGGTSGWYSSMSWAWYIRPETTARITELMMIVMMMFIFHRWRWPWLQHNVVVCTKVSDQTVLHHEDSEEPAAVWAMSMSMSMYTSYRMQSDSMQKNHMFNVLGKEDGQGWGDGGGTTIRGGRYRGGDERKGIRGSQSWKQMWFQLPPKKKECLLLGEASLAACFRGWVQHFEMTLLLNIFVCALAKSRNAQSAQGKGTERKEWTVLGN